MEMTIVPSPITPFELPENWVVENRRRTTGKFAGIVDRYYYDPETGSQFRSLRSVQSYLTGSKEKTPARKRLRFDSKEELFQKRKMATVTRSSTPKTSYSCLNLPDGWVVEECVRISGSCAGKVDKYYIEPGTGRKFRSLISAERHLAELDGSSLIIKESSPDNRISLSYSIVPYRSPTLPLPDGWTVKEVPRSSNICHVDKYYYEPGTGRQFRSLQSVKRYLYEESEYTPAPNLLNSCNFVKPSQKSRSRKKKVSDLMEITSSFDFTKPPTKIKWVHSGPGEDNWRPFLGDSMVPDQIKQQWAEKFIFSVS